MAPDRRVDRGSPGPSIYNNVWMWWYYCTKICINLFILILAPTWGHRHRRWTILILKLSLATPPPPIFNGSPGWALKVILSRIDYFNQFYNGDENEYNIHVMYVATNLPMPPVACPHRPPVGWWAKGIMSVNRFNSFCNIETIAHRRWRWPHGGPTEIFIIGPLGGIVISSWAHTTKWCGGGPSDFNSDIHGAPDQWSGGDLRNKWKDQSIS